MGNPSTVLSMRKLQLTLMYLCAAVDSCTIVRLQVIGSMTEDDVAYMQQNGIVWLCKPTDALPAVQ